MHKGDGGESIYDDTPVPGLFEGMLTKKNCFEVDKTAYFSVDF